MAARSFTWEKPKLDFEPCDSTHVVGFGDQSGGVLPTQYGIAEVLGHPEEALDKQLEIDHDDSHAISGRKHFALLLHSQQPAGSGAAKKIKRMRSEKIQFSYPSKTKTS